ncbi:MAG: c-type cytochrome [Chloroflexota bacterium]|nr:c-type cytochrome [Chloroflexota bacterium]
MDIVFAPRIEASEDVTEIYRLYCSTCHGDVGQGLTDKWRAQNFPESHRNCWQSKCHTYNHDPGGFVFQKTVPAIIGSDTLPNFHTAQELYDYIRTAMPYYAPGLLSDEQYHALTLFLVKANQQQRDLPPTAALPEDLAAIQLQPSSQAPEVTPSITASTGFRATQRVGCEHERQARTIERNM